MNCHSPRPPAPPILRPALPLRELFSRCPVCRGTTTMDGVIIAGCRRVFSVCLSCGSRWDLQGNPISRGQVIRMANVDPMHLPCNHFEGCHSRRPGSHAGRPAGVRDSRPRKYKEKL